MLNALQMFHGHMRWLVILAAVVHLIMLTVALTRPDNLQGRRISGSVFTGLLDLQLLLGLIFLVWKWAAFGFPGRITLEHVTLMIVAVALMHLASKWGREATTVAVRKALAGTAGSVLLIIIGVILINQGWFR